MEGLIQSQLEVTVRSVYGRNMIYPRCARSKLLAQLLRQSTFTPHDIEKIKQLGFVFQLIQDPVEL